MGYEMTFLTNFPQLFLETFEQQWEDIYQKSYSAKSFLLSNLGLIPKQYLSLSITFHIILSPFGAD